MVSMVMTSFNSLLIWQMLKSELLLLLVLLWGFEDAQLIPGDLFPAVLGLEHMHLYFGCLLIPRSLCFLFDRI